MPDVLDARCYDITTRRACEVEELIDLVRPDVRENAAVQLRIPEPRGAIRGMNAVRPKADGLNDGTDRSRSNQLGGANGGAALEPFTVDHGIDTTRRGLDLPDLGELVERCRAGLVDHVVLAVTHHPDA